MKDLLIAQYNSSTPQIKKNGLHWYRDARRWCKEISKNTGVPLEKVVGVLAALSPSNKWPQNKADTINFIVTGGMCKVCTYSVQKEKALYILFFCDTKAEILETLRGPKTKAFFTNIFHCLTDGVVTLDRWALRAVGHHADKTPTKGEREEILTAYKEAAAEVGIRSHEFQAIIWENIKQLA